MDKLAAHGCCCKLLEGVPLVALGCVDRDLHDLVYCQVRRSSQTLHDGLTADTLLNKVFDLLQDLSSEHYYGCCTISNFGVLGTGDIGEDAGGGVDNVEELSLILDTAPILLSQGNSYLHDCSAIVCDSLPAILIDHEQVTTVGA